MIESWGKSRRINIPCNDVRESEVVGETEPEPKIIYEPDLEPEREPEIIDESDPESEVEESLIETHVDILAEPIIELLSSWPAMRGFYIMPRVVVDYLDDDELI